MVWTKSEIPPLAFLIEFTQFELTVRGVVTYEQKKSRFGIFIKKNQIEDIIAITKIS